MPENNAISQIMAVLGINVNPAVMSLEALEKAARDANLTVAALQKTAAAGVSITGSNTAITAAQAAEMQKLAYAQRASAQAEALRSKALKESALATKANAQATTEAARQNALLAQAQKNQAQAALAEARAQQLAARAAASHTAAQKTLADRIFNTNTMFHHANWILTGALMFGALDTMNQGLVQVEKGMKGLVTVLPELAHSQEAYNAATVEAIDLMQKYGATVDEVMTAGRNFGRMYKDVDTVMGLVNNSILTNIVDNTTLEEVVRGNEAALSVYGKELKSTNEVLAFSGKLMDSLTRLSHESMASASDLVSILTRASGAAKNAKVDMDELLGIGASAIRATGLQGQGSNIGNMLKTVFAQLSAPTKEVRKEIEDVGVAMEDTNGQLRSATDIILDLSLKTKDATISQEELNEAVLKAASGKFQYSKLSSLLGQFDEIVKNIARSINSQGMTMQMAAQQMDTVERKAKQLRATLIDTFSGAGDAGLRSSLKGMIDTLNQLLMGFNTVSGGVINATLAFGGLLLVGKLITSVFGAVRPIMATLAGTNATIAATAGMAATGQMSLATATNVATGAMGRLTAASALATGGLTLIAGAIAYYIYKAGEAEKKTMDLAQAQQDAQQKMLQGIQVDQQKSQFLESMARKHGELTKAINSGALSSEELAAKQKYLQAVEDAVISVVDEEGKQMLIRDGITENSINEVVKMIDAKNQQQIATNKAEIKMTEGILNETDYRIKAYNTEIETLQNLVAARGEALVTKTKEISPVKYYGYSILEYLKRGAVGSEAGAGYTPEEIENLYKIPISEQAAIDVLDPYLQGNIAAKKALIDKATARIQELREANIALAGAMKDVAHVASGDFTSAADTAAKSTEKLKTWLDLFKESLAQAINPGTYHNFMDLSDALNNTQSYISLLDSKLGTLKSTIDSGKATASDYTEAYNTLNEIIRATAVEQDRLHDVNENLRLQLADLNVELQIAIDRYNAMAAAGNIEGMREANEAIEATRNEIGNLTTQINQNSQAWWDLEKRLGMCKAELQDLTPEIIKLNYELKATEAGIKVLDAGISILDTAYKGMEDSLEYHTKKQGLIVQKIQQEYEHRKLLKQQLDEGEISLNEYTAAMVESSATIADLVGQFRDLEVAELEAQKARYQESSDDYIQTLEDEAAAMQKFKDAVPDREAATTQSGLDALISERDKQGASLDKYVSKLEKLNDKLADAQKRYKEFSDAGDEEGMAEAQKDIEDITADIDDLNEKISDGADNWIELNKLIIESYENLKEQAIQDVDDLFDAIEKGIDKSKDKWTEYWDSSSQSLKDSLDTDTAEAMASLRADRATDMETLDWLGESYKLVTKSVINDLEDQADALDTTSEANKSMGEAVQNVIDQQVGAIDKARLAYENYVVSMMQDIQRLIDAENAAYEAEKSRLEAEQEATKAASDAKIQAWRDEIDTINELKDANEELDRLAEARRKAEEARTKLSNLESEKNIRRISVAGNWEWVADETAVREARQDLEEAEKTLADTQADIRDNARIKELEELIEYEEEQQKIKDKAYDDQLSALEKNHNKVIAKYEAQYNALEKLFDDFQRQSVADLNTYFDNVYTVTDGQHQKQLTETANYWDNLIALEKQKQADELELYTDHYDDIIDQIDREKKRQDQRLKDYDQQIKDLKKKFADELEAFQDHWDDIIGDDKTGLIAFLNTFASKMDGAFGANGMAYAPFKTFRDNVIADMAAVNAAIASVNVPSGGESNAPTYEKGTQQNPYTADTAYRYGQFREGYYTLPSGTVGKFSSFSEFAAALLSETGTNAWKNKLLYYEHDREAGLAEIARAGRVYMAYMAESPPDIDNARKAHKWADQIRQVIGQSPVYDSNTEPASYATNHPKYPTYSKGGPVTYDQLAILDKGEWVLRAKDVAAMGGYAGVENFVEQLNNSQFLNASQLIANMEQPRLVANIRVPELRLPQVGGQSTVNNNIHNDRRIMGMNVNVSHVYDVSGFIRNLRMLAQT